MELMVRQHAAENGGDGNTLGAWRWFSAFAGFKKDLKQVHRGLHGHASCQSSLHSLRQLSELLSPGVTPSLSPSPSLPPSLSPSLTLSLSLCLSLSLSLAPFLRLQAGDL